MKRRTFLSTLTALIAAPAVPVAAAPPPLTQYFARAKLLARCHDRASPEMFARLMKLDGDTAQGVYRMLKERSVIEAGADGITRALNPLNSNCIPNEARKARDFAQISSDVLQRLKQQMQERLADPPPPTDESSEDHSVSKIDENKPKIA